MAKKITFHNPEEFNQYSEKERKRLERKEKFEKRSNSFWKAFMFTKDGKPKSSFLVYSVFLSFGILFLYVLSFAYVLELIKPIISSMSTNLQNFSGSMICSIVVLFPVILIHNLLKDKRMMFAAYLWLTLYVAACVIALLVIMRSDTEACVTFMKFALWFLFIPLFTGLPLSYALFRRDYVPPRQNVEDEPDWKKYIRRE